MGPKITVDSSTLMNKGLEVIEAHELFGAPAGDGGVGIGFDEIDVVVHPQSIVHSMVEFTDGATIAQLSMPDMRLPIGYALAYPDRIATPFGRIDWTALGRLDFEPPDLEAFPCLGLAYDAGRIGEHRAGLAQRRQRGRRRGLPRRAESAGPRSPRSSTPPSSAMTEPQPPIADAVIDADQRARAVARDLIDERASSPTILTKASP